MTHPVSREERCPKCHQRLPSHAVLKYEPDPVDPDWTLVTMVFPDGREKPYGRVWRMDDDD